MKKILLLVFVFVGLIFSVNLVDAKDNRLYFVEEDNKIYYDSSLLDENVFMKHIDMVPGRSYTDELVIENDTNKVYTLYFKIKPRDQSIQADELLDNINMKIYLDDVEVYNGKAKGLDYTSSGVNLQNAVLLKKFTKKESSRLKVETSLNTDYSDISNNESSYIDWVFYAQYDDDDPQEIVDVPNTNKERFPIITVVSITMCVIGLGIVIYAKKEAK